MHRKEVNERSPMRVFEKSISAAGPTGDAPGRGLGRGNVGVVAAKAGVGKTALLVQVGLDALLREQRVLHISHEHAVDHVRAFYDEILHEISTTSKLASTDSVKLDIERHRLIFSLMTSAASSVAKIVETVGFAREIAHFRPDVIIVDHFDLAGAGEDGIRVLTALAREQKVELWISSVAEATELDRLKDQVAVVVYLQPEHDLVRLRLLKNHDATDLSDLHLRLDPHTMRVIEEDVPPPSATARDAQRFKLVSGGMKGAEAEFGACAERWGLEEVNYTFDGHLMLERQRGVVQLSSEDLAKGDFSLLNASRRLKRTLSEIPLVRSILQTIWHQISNASEVFVVGVIQEDGTVRGGTGWGAELARLWKKPIFVFDQSKRAWFHWNGTAWETATQPVIRGASFAGIGTQALTADGRAAIQDLFACSFGEA